MLVTLNDYFNIMRHVFYILIYFRELVQSLNLGFDVPRKKNLSKSMLTDFAETTKIKVKQDVSVIF